jgi:hypothetical protein
MNSPNCLQQIETASGVSRRSSSRSDLRDSADDDRVPAVTPREKRKYLSPSLGVRLCLA